MTGANKKGGVKYDHLIFAFHLPRGDLQLS